MNDEVLYLDFEQPIVALLKQIEILRQEGEKEGFLQVSAKMNVLEEGLARTTNEIFAHLDDYQKIKLARHPLRPHARDYIDKIFTDFDELYGDRHCAPGYTIIGGLARFEGEPVMVIGQQKGRNIKENLTCHFGMPYPEEYRKALRLMKMAEKFNLPIFTLIDTPGAYPGIDAEERNQSEAIARNLFEMSVLKTPIICTIIGEGGSGGALALGVGDQLLMLEYTIFSAISPEGCASILWKSTDLNKVKEAAKSLQITADKLFNLKLIDRIVAEPLGGAHRDYYQAADLLKLAWRETLNFLKRYSIDQLLEQRDARLRNYGQ